MNKFHCGCEKAVAVLMAVSPGFLSGLEVGDLIEKSSQAVGSIANSYYKSHLGKRKLMNQDIII